MKAAFVILWLAPIWCAAVLFKVVGARSRKEPYRFAMWDGGLMLSGNELGPVGQILWASMAVGLAAVAIAVLARGMPS
ncbi:MAG: hypothetical protein ABJE66_02705 [Deltaproteobacteria bacterium]